MLSGLEFVGKCTGKVPNLTYYKVSVTTTHHYFNINKAREQLGYTPVVSLEDAYVVITCAMAHSNPELLCR